jgi:hypothetical protein
MAFDSFGIRKMADNSKENTDEYVNTYNHYKILRNESGMFECDDDGKLLRFYPDVQNLLDETIVKDRFTFGKSYYKPCVHSLIIPEGVTAIGENFFRYGFVEEIFHFPNTLRSIGDERDHGVFAKSHLPDVVIPESVETIGIFAFGSCTIKSIKLTRFFDCEYLRQFNDAHIGTLYLPYDCRWNHGFDGFVYLHEAKNVEFY